jgi:hypothetical protein
MSMNIVPQIAPQVKPNLNNRNELLELADGGGAVSDKDHIAYKVDHSLSLEIGMAIKARLGECCRNTRQAYFLLDSAIYTEGLVFCEGHMFGHSWLTVNGKVVDPTIFAWDRLADGYLPLVMSKELPMSGGLYSWSINTSTEFDEVRYWGNYWSMAYNIGQEFGISAPENLDDLRCYDRYHRERIEAGA